MRNGMTLMRQSARFSACNTKGTWNLAQIYSVPCRILQVNLVITWVFDLLASRNLPPISWLDQPRRTPCIAWQNISRTRHNPVHGKQPWLRHGLKIHVTIVIQWGSEYRKHLNANILKFGFQKYIRNKMASICLVFKWLGYSVFQWHLKTGPNGIQPLFNYLNTKQVLVFRSPL